MNKNDKKSGPQLLREYIDKINGKKALTETSMRKHPSLERSEIITASDLTEHLNSEWDKIDFAEDDSDVVEAPEIGKARQYKMVLTITNPMPEPEDGNDEEYAAWEEAQDIEVGVDYRHYRASGDGWHSPREPEGCDINGVYRLDTGEEITDLLDEDTLDYISSKALEASQPEEREYERDEDDYDRDYGLDDRDLRD